MASHFFKNMVLALVPPLRRARDHIHHQNRLIETARQDVAAAIAERDAARSRVAELEADLEKGSAPQPAVPPEALLNELDRLRREVQSLDAAHYHAVELNNDLLAQLPRLSRAH